MREYDLLSIVEGVESQAIPLQVNEGFASLVIGENERNMLNRLNRLSSEKVIWEVKSGMMTIVEMVTEMVIGGKVLLFGLTWYCIYGHMLMRIWVKN